MYVNTAGTLVGAGSALAVTGSNVSELAVVAGAAILALGSLVLLRENAIRRARLGAEARPE